MEFMRDVNCDSVYHKVSINFSDNYFYERRRKLSNDDARSSRDSGWISIGCSLFLLALLGDEGRGGANMNSWLMLVRRAIWY